SFDIVSIAFGIRNVTEPDRALAEFRRVLRPGGRLIILEFGRPSPAPIRVLNQFYTHRVMPLTATLISRDRTGAYRYLPRSVDTFLTEAEMTDAMSRAGFSVDPPRRMTFGVCIAYRGHASEKKNIAS
ncbi:MAG: class I SAM-dependent methyltransferase, partial [Phycisphaerales bacterium]|nr:class I SAM-dependent methyltransferase [Phycisphaerales bacterium]